MCAGARARARFHPGASKSRHSGARCASAAASLANGAPGPEGPSGRTGLRLGDGRRPRVADGPAAANQRVPGRAAESARRQVARRAGSTCSCGGRRPAGMARAEPQRCSGGCGRQALGAVPRVHFFRCCHQDDLAPAAEDPGEGGIAFESRWGARHWAAEGAGDAAASQVVNMPTCWVSRSAGVPHRINQGKLRERKHRARTHYQAGENQLA